MNVMHDKKLAEISVHEASAKSIGSAITFGTHGRGFWAVQIVLAVGAASLLSCALFVAAYAGAAALEGSGGAWQVAAGAALFAAPMATFLAIQLPFLASLRRELR